MLSKEGHQFTVVVYHTSMCNESKDASNVGDCDRKSNSCFPGNIMYESGYKSDSSGTGV